MNKTVNIHVKTSQLAQAAIARDAMKQSQQKNITTDELKHLFVKQILIDKLNAFENAIFQEELRITTTDLVS